MKHFRKKLSAAAAAVILSVCMICATVTTAGAAQSRFFLCKLTRCSSNAQSCRDTGGCAEGQAESLCDLLSRCGLSARQCETLGRILSRCLNCRGNNAAEPSGTEATDAPAAAPTQAVQTPPTEIPAEKPTEAYIATEAPASEPTSTPAEVPTTAPTEATTIPPTEVTTEASPVDDYTISAYEKEVIALVNAIRRDNGLDPLSADAQLCRVARVKSQDMREKGYFSHTSPTYGSPFEMMSRFGVSYRAAGENIAMGYRTPESVVEGWMNSPGHRANILNENYKRIGVGYVADGSYWTQLFAG